MEDSSMGLIEIALLLAIGWLVVWTILVFLQTVFYGLLAGITGWAGVHVAMTPTDPQLSQALFEISGAGVGTVEIAAILLIIASWKFLGRFGSCFASASHRYRAGFTMVWD
jgi:hypothetical protein